MSEAVLIYFCAIGTVIGEYFRRKIKWLDVLSLQCLECESRMHDLEKIERRYHNELIVNQRLSTQLLEVEIEKDVMAQQLAERTLEMEDARIILEKQSAAITIQSKVDEEEKKRFELLERIISNFIDVRIDGNSKAEGGRIVKLMSKHFTIDHLERFCQFELSESGENIYDDGSTLIDRCADVYMWMERKGKTSKLIRLLREEFDHVKW